MGDSASQPPDESKSLLPSDEPDSQATQGSPRWDRNVRKGRQEISSQQTVSQTSFGHSQQYAPHYQPLQTRSDPFNLNQLSIALPDSSYQNYGQLAPRFPPAAGPSGLVYPSQNTPQYAAPQAINLANPPYAYQTPFQGGYVTGNPPSLAGMGNQFYHQGYVGRSQQQGPPFIIQPNHYPLHNSVFPGIQQPTQYGPRGNVSDEHQIALQKRAGGAQGISDNTESTTGLSPVVRGPPRKPRRTGHAIWIGNLPPQTELMNLVSHVCKEAPGLESVFLMSKTNCAFANFKDEETCAAAQAKIHDSRFQNVGLTSRLRRNSIGAAGSAPTPAEASSDPIVSSESASPAKEDDAEAAEAERDDSSSTKDKFFVVKSHTVEDLELSIRNGIWATQSHNEAAFNKAYHTAENVYLIFSANKSGEFFGYARMASPVNNDPSATIEFARHAVEGPEKITPVPATEFIPKGRIIQDFARGSIFWEVEREDDDDDTSSNGSVQEDTQSWGNPFKVEWISTTRLPFYRTRGLRNPWNSNRFVKVARDGTELETTVGRKLVRLFHRTPSPVAQPVGQIPGMPIPMVGYPPMRPFQ